MKHKYLSLIALAGAMFMSTGAWAQWDEPAVPELEIKNVDAVESGKSYYIMNVGAEQFITGANSWSTQISLTTEGVVPENTDVSPALAIYVADSTGTSANLSGVTGVSLRLDGTYTVYGASGARTFTNTYLFRDGTESQGFMDHGTQDMGYIWKITKAENGYYRIQSAEGDPAYPNSETEFAGWDSTLGAADDVDANTIVYFNMTEEQQEEGACIDWMFIDAAQFLVQLAAYDARVALYELLVSVDDYGYDVDTKAAGAVYNNPNATKAELEAAINDLKYAINVAEFQAQFEGATADDPLEVTDICLVNANFGEGNINGWDNSFQSGVTAVNCGYQGASYTNNGSTLEGSGGSALDDDENASYLNGFIEAWRPNENDPHHIGDAQLSQTVYGLPTGMYKLTCDVVANQQGNFFPNPVTGVKLFIATDTGEEVFQEVATGNGNPEHFSITFTCPKGVRAMTFGLKTENTTANWIAADNFRIYYFGETEKTLAQLNLLEAIKVAELFKDNNEGNQAYEPVREAFETALTSAQEVADANASDEECAAAQATLEAAKADYSASLKAYDDLAIFLGYGDLPSKLDEYMEQASKLGDLYDELEPLEAELKDGYSDGTITTERINEVIGGFLTKIREYIKKGNINPGDDITILLDNPDFSEGTTSNPTGWTINNGSLTELATATGNIETWHKTFDISQTITDMPAGIYDITVQGFVRHDNVSVTDLTYFYAGDTKTCLMTLEDQWSFEPIYTSDGPNPQIHDTNYDATMTVDGETAYKCNGMGGAYYWFQTEIPADLYPTFKYKAPSDQNWDGDNYYTNHIKVVLSQPGDFTIGLGTTAGEDWIIWDNFKIKYLGDDMNIYIQMINEAFAKLQETHDGDEAFVTKKAEDDFNAVAKKVEDAANLQTGKEALALIDEINQISSYISAGSKAGSNLQTTYYLYAEYLMPTVESSDATFPALLSQIESSFANPAEIADNEAIDALVAELKKGWVKYVMADHIADASAENPQDVSAAIFNPDYTDYDMNTEQQTNSEGWTNEGSNGSTIFDGIYYAEIEFFNTNFNHYQTIQGLEPGWYIVANDAFYRAGDANAMTTAYNDSVPALNSYMYAVVAGDTVATKYVHGMFDGAQIEPTYSDGEVTVNLTQEEGLNGTYYVPNLMGSAYEFLNIEDEEGNKFYNNQLVVEVKEDGVLTIGMRKTELIANDWTVITNWSLSYIGKEAPVAVESLEAKQSVKAAQFFGIDGRQQSRIQRGVNIVRMADGSVRKVMVK